MGFGFTQSAYMKLNLGYGIGLGPNNAGSNYFSIDNEGSNELVKGTYGRGLYYGGSFSYFFTKNIGAELQVNYLYSQKLKTDSYVIIHEPDAVNSTAFYKDKLNNKSEASFGLISPALVVTSGFDYLDPYVSMGPVLGFGSIRLESKIMDVDIIQRADGQMISDPLVLREQIKYEYSGRMALGVRSGIGLNVYLNDYFTIFGETNWILMNYTPKKRVIVQYLRNEQDITNQLYTSEKEIEYVKKYDIEENKPNSDRPTKAIREDFTFNALSFNIGLRLKVFSKMEEKPKY